MVNHDYLAIHKNVYDLYRLLQGKRAFREEAMSAKKPYLSENEELVLLPGYTGLFMALRTDWSRIPNDPDSKYQAIPFEKISFLCCVGNVSEIDSGAKASIPQQYGICYKNASFGRRPILSNLMR